MQLHLQTYIESILRPLRAVSGFTSGLPVKSLSPTDAPQFELNQIFVGKIVTANDELECQMLCQADAGVEPEYCHSITFKMGTAEDNCIFNYFAQETLDAVVATDAGFVSAPRNCPGIKVLT